jgi:nitrogen regulatory protein PII
VTRIEIIANRAVQDDIIEELETAVDDFHYTVVPVVLGRGRQHYKLGTSTWPEENFLLIAYMADDAAEKAQEVIRGIKERFPTEGIKLFSLIAT